MYPWASDKRRYFPILHAKGADLQGFSQLPSGDGAYLMPLIPLSRWGNSHKLENTLEKIARATNGINDQFIADIADDIGQHIPLADRKEVHSTLASLASPDDEFARWRAFIANNPMMIPVLRNGDIRGMFAQVRDFVALGRGMVLRIRPGREPGWPVFAPTVVEEIARLNAVDALMIVVDMEQIREPLAPAAQATGIIRACMAAAGNRKITVSTAATSFPPALEGLANQIVKYPIIERQMNGFVEDALGKGATNFLYSDYGSARVRETGERKGPGYPRVDYATRTAWPSNRQKEGEAGASGYKAAAEMVLSLPEWIKELDIYGANMIREAAVGKLEKRCYAGFWVGARVNLHLHRQAHYNSTDEEFLGTESDWSD